MKPQWSPRQFGIFAAVWRMLALGALGFCVGLSQESPDSKKAPYQLSDEDAVQYRHLAIAEQDAYRVAQGKQFDRLAFEAKMREKYNGQPCELTPFGTWTNCDKKLPPPLPPVKADPKGKGK